MTAVATLLSGPLLWSEDFRDQSWGTRPLALGGAYIGVVGDGYVPFYNPAGSAHLLNDEATFSFGKPAARPGEKSRSLGSFSYMDANNSGQGAYGVWWAHSTISEISANRRENALAFNLSRHVNNIPAGSSLSWGVNLKYLSNKLEAEKRRDQSALSADLGVSYIPSPALSLGAVVRDVLRPRVGVTSDEKLPMSLGGGAALWLGHRTMLALDMVQTQGRGTEIRGGVETSFVPSLRLRLGTNSDQMVYGLGLRVGAASWLQADVEYAYADPIHQDKEERLHFVSLRARFGKDDPVEEYKGMTKSGLRAIRQREGPKEKDTPALIKATSSLEERKSLVFGPGDVLEIHVIGHPELDVSSVTVDSWGFIRLPYIGELEVQGFTEEKVESALSKVYSEFFKAPPQVEVSVKEYNSRSILILGEVHKPGRYVLERSMTLRDAVVMAGLPTPRAATWRAFVIRQGPEGPRYLHINLHRVLYRANLENNIELEIGDVVYLPIGYLDAIFAFVGRVLNPIFGLTNNVVRPVLP